MGNLLPGSVQEELRARDPEGRVLLGRDQKFYFSLPKGLGVSASDQLDRFIQGYARYLSSVLSENTPDSARVKVFISPVSGDETESSAT